MPQPAFLHPFLYRNDIKIRQREEIGIDFAVCEADASQRAYVWERYSLGGGDAQRQKADIDESGTHRRETQ